ncbi:hypothetical protein CP532_4983 [Ophiocordyceps camponoti-leonardi (nom. inval.)]|nr:hypothetical protein CP532_4983 [Ophiocordyceps camponoti-leonardi (nom. inval.)]
MEQSMANSELLYTLRELQQGQSQLLSALKSITDKLGSDSEAPSPPTAPLDSVTSSDSRDKTSTEFPSILASEPSPQAVHKSGYSSRIILTTYPKQIGIDPIALDWGNPNPEKRGPVLVNNSPSKCGGSYSIYYALAVASKELNVDHRPDFTNTEPAVQLGPFPQWGQREKIVAMDPWGHLVPWTFQSVMERENIDLRPTVAITRAHMKLAELEDSVKTGRLIPDGKVCLNELGELSVTKFAVEPVWYLPGVAERFGIDEATLRRSLFENTGGSYPEVSCRSIHNWVFISNQRQLITRGDIKVFLPPIGGLTVYCFGDPAKMSDESARLTLRIHDECNGSDVFGSDICTCRPYLIFGIEEAVKEAQDGGSGVVIYFRKEGRALGEVTKVRCLLLHPYRHYYCTNHLPRLVKLALCKLSLLIRDSVVYNARKRGADRASDYFTRTENIAGIKDMRFQALMPDILHWLGIKKIDRMLSMSNMKYDAIVRQGIPIHERVELPEELIPADSRVEIDAKITAGYFTAGKRLTAEELKSVQGRIWDESVIIQCIIKRAP